VVNDHGFTFLGRSHLDQRRNRLGFLFAAGMADSYAGVAPEHKNLFEVPYHVPNFF
jgi:hypothetical protein